MLGTCIELSCSDNRLVLGPGTSVFKFGLWGSWATAVLYLVVPGKKNKTHFKISTNLLKLFAGIVSLFLSIILFFLIINISLSKPETTKRFAIKNRQKSS